jgi:trans-aconitate methyltransferase
MSTERAATQWQPAKYLAFERLRLRPALDLLDRVPHLPSETDAPAASKPDIRIVDLGAGVGNMASPFLYVGCISPPSMDCAGI